MKTLLVLAALLLSFANAGADILAQDPYNTYLWNRSNVIANNGQVDQSPWYEWWYYKVIDPATGRAFFFTYGVINPWDSGKTLGGTQAVVDAGEFTAKTMIDQKFPVAQFQAAYDRTFVQIADSTATDKALVGHVSNDGHNMEWNLSIDKNWSFDAMASTKTMKSDIYWYPAQASATMNGWIKLDGVTYHLTNAPGYQDRNWGDGFPKWWTWLVSNNFKNSPGTVLAAGGGEPKVFNTAYVQGLCIGLHYNGKDYAFRTFGGDNVSFDISWGKWEVDASSSTARVTISANAPKDKFMMLPFTSPQGATFYDYETLTGSMTVKVYERSSILAEWKQVGADLVTENAGIEWGTPTPVSFTNLFSTAVHLQ